jgi:hypothetical protein
MPNFRRFCLSFTKELATGARGVGFLYLLNYRERKFRKGACDAVLSHLSQNRAEDVGKEQQVQVSGVLEVLGDEVKVDETFDRHQRDSDYAYQPWAVMVFIRTS